jgi:hypothetical protein
LDFLSNFTNQNGQNIEEDLALNRQHVIAKVHNTDIKPPVGDSYADPKIQRFQNSASSP